ncbi:GGDEF domain-containing protein [Nitrosophilus kaiyonis]|uniref:GGDEF domain-containing protein n=1 Tax=Nitrosophilus kaiyonis TaxID=2930200 RepID=UPI0024908517|nr:GGDEF domain-containing protein [Nitrosophilus kaiyonis]
MKNNILKIVVFLSIYILSNISLYYYFNNDKNNRISIYFIQKVQKLFSEYKATKNGFKMLSDFVYDNISQNKDLLNLIYTLKNSKTDKKKEIRKKIYKNLLNFYNLLKKYKIYYMTLYYPDGKVFLRMHQPYRFGDSLYSKNSFKFINNPSLLLAEIETGIIYNYPLFLNNKLIANMKISISYDVLKQELTKLFNSDYEYILHKDFISNSTLRTGQKLFIQSDINENFFYEESSIKRDRSRVTNKIIHKINLKLKNKISNKLNLKKNFAVAVKIDGKYYIVTFLTISPYQKIAKNIGYLISYEQDDTFEIFNNVFWHNIILGNVIIVLILLFIFYFLRINERLKLIAATDKLTGLFNRNKFYEIANIEIERANRYNRPLSLIIFDIDFFKRINDRYGHNIGDYVLKTLSSIIKKNTRKSDYIFRWGGEEFIILTPETDILGAKKLAEKLRKAVENFEFDTVKYVTISLGVAQYNKKIDKDIDSLIKRADDALYRSKESGRNMVTIYEVN